MAWGAPRLTIIDDDKVEISNLQRQVLHSEHDLGTHKSQSAQETLNTLNSQVSISALIKRLSDTALQEQLLEHDIVVDCSDNLATRKQLNRWCFVTQTPLVSEAAIRMAGQHSCFIADPNQACYQCLSVTFGEQNLSCMEAGIMSPVVGIIGAMQALEVIKILTGFGKPLVNKLLMFDGMTSEWRSFHLLKNPECIVCSTPVLKDN